MEYEEVSRYYYMYQFSDEVLLLSSADSPFPSVFNFVKSGLLSEQEAWDVLTFRNGEGENG